MNQAEYVIDAFGGIRPTARLLDEWPGTVQKWKKKGYVPSDRHHKILEIAKKEGKKINATSLINPPPNSG